VEESYPAQRRHGLFRVVHRNRRGVAPGFTSWRGRALLCDFVMWFWISAPRALTHRFGHENHRASDGSAISAAHASLIAASGLISVLMSPRVLAPMGKLLGRTPAK
jgi:hypothetical protein